MNATPIDAQLETATALYVGATAACVAGLLPYINLFIFPSYAIGATVAVWYATSVRRQSLTLRHAAKLGFYSSFLGSMAAVVLYDIIWQLFDYQLWQQQDSNLLLALLSSFASESMRDAMSSTFAQNATKSFAWYMLILQIFVNAFLAGIVGTLVGMVALKIFRRTTTAS